MQSATLIMKMTCVSNWILSSLFYNNKVFDKHNKTKNRQKKYSEILNLIKQLLTYTFYERSMYHCFVVSRDLGILSHSHTHYLFQIYQIIYCL